MLKAGGPSIEQGALLFNGGDDEVISTPHGDYAVSLDGATENRND